MRQNNDERSRMLGNDPVEKVVNKLAGPAIVGMLVTAIYNIVDTMFVGMLGKEALGAATVALPVFLLISAVGMMYGLGAGSYISRMLGADNHKQAEKTLSTAFIITIVTAIIFAIICLANLDTLLVMFGADDQILPLAHEFTKILLYGSIFTMINMTLNNSLRAEGSAKMSMIALATGALMNIILDPIFIFTFGMGVKGAALATVLAQMISTILLLAYYFSHKSLLHLNLKHFSTDKEIYVEIFKIGTPALLRQCLTSFAMGFLTKAASNYGVSAVAALGIINRVYMFGLYILLGYTQGFLPVAGFNYGAKKYDRLLEAIKVTVRNTTIYVIVITIVYMIFAEGLSRLFIDDPEVIKIAAKGIRYFVIFMPTLGFIVTFNNLFQALGYAAIAMILSIARQGIFLIPAIIILPKFFGLDGVLLSQTFADGCTLIVTIGFAIYIIKKLKKLTLEDKSELA